MQYSWVGIQSSSSRPVSKKRDPSNAISLRLETIFVPGAGSWRLIDVVVGVTRVRDDESGPRDGANAFVLVRAVAAHRARRDCAGLLMVL